MHSGRRGRGGNREKKREKHAQAETRPCLYPSVCMFYSWTFFSACRPKNIQRKLYSVIICEKILCNRTLVPILHKWPKAKRKLKLQVVSCKIWMAGTASLKHWRWSAVTLLTHRDCCWKLCSLYITLLLLTSPSTQVDVVEEVQYKYPTFFFLRLKNSACIKRYKGLLMQS